MTKITKKQFSPLKWFFGFVLTCCPFSRLLNSVNVDFENRLVYPVGVENDELDPARLPPKKLFVVNITEARPTLFTSPRQPTVIFLTFEPFNKHVCLLQVVDVGHFWGFQADEASLRKQRRLTAEINQRSLRPISVSLYPNLLCLAPFSEDSDPSLYYRGKILHLRSNSVEVTQLHTLTHCTLQDVFLLFFFFCATRAITEVAAFHCSIWQNYSTVVICSHLL